MPSDAYQRQEEFIALKANNFDSETTEVFENKASKEST
jgi:hypothetical protein